MNNNLALLNHFLRYVKCVMQYITIKNIFRIVSCEIFFNLYLEETFMEYKTLPLILVNGSTGQKIKAVCQ